MLCFLNKFVILALTGVAEDESEGCAIGGGSKGGAVRAGHTILPMV